MRFSSAAAAGTEIGACLRALCEPATAGLEGADVDLAAVFFSSHFEDEADAIARELAARFPNARLLGCSAEGVIGPESELERVPAASLMLASLPGARLTPFSIPAGRIPELEDPSRLPEMIGVDPADEPAFILFGDPFTVPVPALLGVFDRVYSKRPVFGGMASGCDGPGQAALISDHRVLRDGCAGLALSGAVEVTAAVSQGCRPIGQPFVITRGQRNIVLELGGKPALEQLRDLLEALPPEDARLLERTQALFVGRVINEYQEKFGRGDFLIRNVMGFDPKASAIVVGDEVRVGATIQFHVRDEQSADEDLRQMLGAFAGSRAPAGALIFSCNGRGTRMWSEPNHDISVLRELCGPVPAAGFFAAGELGPVGGRNFIHGHTASLMLFRPRS